jgi:flagellar basal-body rod protein FlgC
VANNEKDAFRAKRTVFQAVLDQQFKDTEGKSTPYNGGVRIASLVDDPSPIRKVYEPGSPVADKEGYIYTGNVNEMTEMVEMMAASRSYQNNVEVVNTARQLMMRTVDIIRS